MDLEFEESLDIGFRLQFFCKKCKLILSPHKLVRGCPKCQNEIDLRMR
jgi:Zn finger protein HypA/HybF involved in hydrogenase expression